MAVLFITHKYPPSTGGMEKQSFELINGCRKHLDVHTIVFDGSESIVMFFVKLKSRVYHMMKLHPDIDIIHLNDGLMATIFFLLKIQIEGIKIVVTFHGLDVVFPLKLYQKYLLPKLQRYHTFICVSDATKQACRERGFDENKLFVVDNGVENVLVLTSDNPELSMLRKYGINDDSIIILAIGRPVKRKGFSWFAKDVMPLLNDKFKFVHIGDVKVSESFWFHLLPKKIQELASLFSGKATDAKALKDVSETNINVILCGKVSEEDKVTIIKNASMMVMPNIKVKGDMEGFGLVALEGSILGKTVLAANMEGITNAIHDGKNGYLLESEKPEIWANKIKEIGKNKVLFDTQVRDYTLQHFSWEKMCLEYVQVFRQIRSV